MVTLQNAENALKTVYLGTVTELLNTKVNPLLTKIRQTSADVWGKEIRKAVKYGINGGIGAGDETGDLPAAHSTNYLQFVSTLKNLYGQIEISDKAIRASADGRGAFTDLLTAELEDLLTASKFNLGRMLFGDGTGKLGTITTGATYVMDSVRNLVEGMVVDVYNGSTKANSGLKIASVDRVNNKVTFTTTPTIGNNYSLYVQGSRDKEITGLGAIFDGTTIYGVSKANNPFLNPHIQASAGAISDRLIQTVVDKLELNTGSNIDFLACSADVKYAYQDYLSQYRRNIDVMELAGGFRTLSFNGIPLVYDRFVENGTMYLLDTSAFKLHQLCDWRYLETENGKILRQTQGKPTYSATLVKYCDLICDRPNGQAKISGITAPAST
ncbi:MAG: phage major capsid protein [Firmicutes bacterium]|nr:phage major capsid protein [Bacillota bacterium]